MDAQTSTQKPARDHGGSDDGLVALGYILSGLVFYGGLGWLGWKQLGQLWMFPLGLIIGMAASMYVVIRRYHGPAVTANRAASPDQTTDPALTTQALTTQKEQ